MLTEKQKELIKNLNSVKTSVKTRSEYNAYQQMLTRIRRFGFGAIEDLSFLAKELPDEEITKIFTSEPMDMLFDSIRKLASLSEIKEQVSLSEFIKDLNKNIMSPDDIEAHEKLKVDFFYSPELLQKHMGKLEIELGACQRKNEDLKQFLEKHGLKEKYVSERVQQVKADQVRRLKSYGWTDEEIDNELNQNWENVMKSSIWE